MKRVVTGLVVASVVVVGFAATFVSVHYSAMDAVAAPAKKSAAKPGAAPTTPQPPAATAAPGAATSPAGTPATAATGPGQEKVAFVFANEQQLNEFAKLSQQRQGILVRMSVLRAYFSEEQAGLAELDKKTVDEYKLDMNKNYSYDPQRRALIEREPSSDAHSAGAATGSAVPAPLGTNAQ